MSIHAAEDPPTCGGRDGHGGGSPGAPRCSCASHRVIRCFRGGGGSSGGRDNGGVVVLALRAVKPAGAVALGAHGCATISASRGFIAGVATGPRSPWRADAPVAHCRATVGTPVSDILRLTSGAGVAGWAEAFGQVGDATVLADDWKRGGGGVRQKDLVRGPRCPGLTTPPNSDPSAS